MIFKKFKADTGSRPVLTHCYVDARTRALMNLYILKEIDIWFHLAIIKIKAFYWKLRIINFQILMVNGYTLQFVSNNFEIKNGNLVYQYSKILDF